MASAKANRGINYGNLFAFDTTYPTAQVTSDIAFWSNYCGCVRIALCQYADTNGINNTKTAALAFKAAGFYVSWGITAGSNQTLNSWNTFVSNLPTYAAWAQANGMDEFMLGNEEDFHNNSGNVTSAQVRSDLKGAVAGVKAVFSRIVSYCFDQGSLSAWNSIGPGSIDMMGINVYSDIQNVINNHITDFGSKAFISEWAADHPFIGMNMTNEQYRVELLNRTTFIESKNMKFNFFTARHSGTDQQWAIQLSNGTLRAGATSVIGGRVVGSEQANTPERSNTPERASM